MAENSTVSVRTAHAFDGWAWQQTALSPCAGVSCPDRDSCGARFTEVHSWVSCTPVMFPWEGDMSGRVQDQMCYSTYGPWAKASALRAASDSRHKQRLWMTVSRRGVTHQHQIPDRNNAVFKKEVRIAPGTSFAALMPVGSSGHAPTWGASVCLLIPGRALHCSVPVIGFRASRFWDRAEACATGAASMPRTWEGWTQQGMHPHGHSQLRSPWHVLLQSRWSILGEGRAPAQASALRPFLAADITQ